MGVVYTTQPGLLVIAVVALAVVGSICKVPPGMTGPTGLVCPAGTGKALLLLEEETMGPVVTGGPHGSP